MVHRIGGHHNNRPIHPGAVATTRTPIRQAPVDQVPELHLDIVEVAAAVGPVAGPVVQGLLAEVASFIKVVFN